jgi:hypothetical protein
MSKSTRSKFFVYILSIRPDEHTGNDLKQILNLIGMDIITSLVWGIENLDWLGNGEAHQFTRELDEAENRRLLIPGEQLLKLVKQTWQTIEGEFVGYRTERDAEQFLKTGSLLTRFPTSTAELAIEVKDGSIFDVYLRERKQAKKLARHFPNTHWQDPDDFVFQFNE